MAIWFRHIASRSVVTFPLKITLSEYDGKVIPKDTYTFSQDFMKNATPRQLQDVGIEEYEHTSPIALPSTNPVDYPLNAVQFFAMLDILGKSDAVDAAIGAIANATEKAVAKAKFKHSVTFHRDDPLFSILAPIVGLTNTQIDTAWLQAKDIT